MYPLCCELEPRLPSLEDRLRRVLALWLKGTLPAHNGCQDSVAMALEPHGCFETLRRELREWTNDDADRIRSWGPDREVDVAACFLERLRCVRDLWTSDRSVPEAEARPWCWPSTPRTIGMLGWRWWSAWSTASTRSGGLDIVEAQARGSRVTHFQRLLRRPGRWCMSCATRVWTAGTCGNRGLAISVMACFLVPSGAKCR